MGEAKKIKEKAWVTKDKRFIVFLDIMGFKDFVARNSHEAIYEVMSKLRQTKKVLDTFLVDGPDEVSADYKYRSPFTTSFSDSFILFSKDNSAVSLEIISESARFLIADAIMNSILMKGAIAFGEISVNKANQIYFGQPIIDSYLLHEEVYYYGITAHNSIDAFMKDYEEDQITKLGFKEIETPMKNGMISHYNLDWFENLNDINNPTKTIKEIFHDSMKKIKAITSGSPRKYIDNTIKIFNQLYQENQ